MNEKRSDNLIFEAYQQINEWGEDLDPANNPLDALKYRIAEMEGQNPRVTARYAREVVDEILHMGKAVSAEEVEDKHDDGSDRGRTAWEPARPSRPSMDSPRDRSRQEMERGQTPSRFGPTGDDARDYD